MDSVNPNESIAERKVESSECLNLPKQNNVTSNVSCEMIKIDASLIERELAASLTLIESGLTHLDIEAAHLLGPKKNDKVDIQYSSKSSAASKSKDVFNNATRNEAVHYESKRLMKADLHLFSPPDLTFSFYSSKEYINPSAPLESPNSVLSAENIISSAPLESQNSPSSRSGSESKTSDKVEQLFSKRNLESDNCTPKPTSEKMKSDGSVIGMHDITESLLEIKSALDNLDREAEYLLNPVGFKLPYCEPSLETPSSLENN